MMSERKNSNALGSTPTRRQLIAGMALAFGGLTPGATEAWASTEEEISRTAESIHQEHVFKASRKRVYEALTETSQFNKVVMLSEAMKSGMPPGAAPTQIGREAGGAFSLFGGYVTGRQLELVPNERIVQAWRGRKLNSSWTVDSELAGTYFQFFSVSSTELTSKGCPPITRVSLMRPSGATTTCTFTTPTK